MTETEEVQEAEQTVVTCLQTYCKEKINLKTLKVSMRQEEYDALQTEEISKRAKVIKDLQEELVILKDEAVEELAKEDAYQKLRLLILKGEEDTATARGKLVLKMKELPPEPTQLTFMIEDTPHQADIVSKKELYINGKLDK